MLDKLAEINIRFEKHPTSNDSIGYRFYSGESLITGYSTLGYAEVGSWNAGWYLKNWPNGTGGKSIRYFNVNNTSLAIKSEENTVDGQTANYNRKRTNEFNTGTCGGSYNYQYAIPQPSDSVTWTLEKGNANFSFTSNFLIIKSSTDGTIMQQHIYFNGKATLNNYVVNLPDTCQDEIVNQTTITIEHCKFPHNPFSDRIITAVPWTFKYDVLSGDVDYTQLNSASMLSTINSATDNAVLVEKMVDPANNPNKVYVTEYTIHVKGCEIDCIDKTIIDSSVSIIEIWQPVCGCNKVTYSNASAAYYYGGISNYTEGECPTDEIEINNCNFPHRYQYATPQPSDSVNWKIEAGFADFTTQLNLLKITSAIHGTILNKIVYYNGNFTVTPVYLSVTGACNEETHTLEGTIKSGHNTWEHGMVYLYDTIQDNAVDSVRFNKGIYLFKGVSIGTYTLFAIPYTDSLNRTKIEIDYLPTYYENKLTKREAQTFEVTGNTFGIDIELINKNPTISAIKNTQNLTTTNGLFVYPNPFSNELKIEFNQEEAEISIVNIHGNIVYDSSLEQPYTINTADWSEGIYFIEMKTGTGVNIFKVVK